MIRLFLLALALLFGTGAAQAQTPFDSISQGDYGSWEFPEGDTATWGQKPASAADFGGQIVGNLHPYFLISTASQNDAPMGRAVWHGTATAPFLNLNIMGGTGPDTQVRALDASGRVIGKASGQGTLTFKQKCIFLGFDSVGKPFTVEVIDASPTASVALDAMSFGDKPDTIEQQKVEEIVYGFAPRLKTPGLWVSVALDGEVVAAVAYGFKRASTRAPARLTDELRTGSISKPVAGTVIGLLVDKGVIRYDTKIKDVFPELVGKCKPMCLDATLGQLITHWGGIAYGAPVNSIKGENGSQYRYRASIEFLNNPNNVPPGTKEIYAAGVLIASAMAEKAAGFSFDKMLQETMVNRFGLSSFTTAVTPENGITGNGVWAHNQSGLEQIADADLIAKPEAHPYAHPLGGYRFNILDLAKFGSIHSEGQNFGYQEFSPECFLNMHQHLEQKGITTFSGLVGVAGANLMHDGNTGLGEYAFMCTSPPKRAVFALYMNSEDVNIPPNNLSGSHEIYEATCDAIKRLKF